MVRIDLYTQISMSDWFESDLSCVLYIATLLTIDIGPFCPHLTGFSYYVEQLIYELPARIAT